MNILLQIFPVVSIVQYVSVARDREILQYYN